MNIPPDSPETPAMDCLLTLALPSALEEEVLDLLRGQSDLVSGFTVLHGYGLGANVTLSTVMERVEGRARRVQVQVLLRSQDVAPLIARLRAALQAPHVFYWVVPLQGWGRLS